MVTAQGIGNTYHASNKPPGIYHYRSQSISFSGGGYLGIRVWVSGEATVVVGAPSELPPELTPELDSLSEQYNYDFQVRRGDINGDGMTDLYVERMDGDADNGVIYRSILQQVAGGAFEVMAARPSQLGTAANWPQAVLDIVLRDLNVDGHIDLLITGVGQIISGGLDQILFSSGRTFQRQAATTTAVDATFRKFFDNYHSWMQDDTFFQQNVLTITVPVYNIGCIYIPYGGYGSYGGYLNNYQGGGYGNYGGGQWYCYLYPGLIIYRYFNPLVIAAAAVEVVGIMGGLCGGQTEIGEAVGLLEGVLGSVLGGVFGDVVRYNNDFSQADHDDEQRLTLSVIRFISAQFSSSSNAVSVRARWVPLILGCHVRGNARGHFSVHYEARKAWVSAFSSRPAFALIGYGGYLEAEDGNAKDNVENTVPWGSLSRPTAYASHSAFWDVIHAKYSVYDKKRPRPIYCLYPEDGSGYFSRTSCEGYNSNSFAIGILTASDVSNFMTTNPVKNLKDEAGFPGSETPVPSSAFRR